ncbi:MAG TPA: DUF2726 domain-containing protein [Sphingomonadaceae bacterium]|nr:DUF2726 domain-containing protein [Sphingomonadaceae bacterium]
MLATLDALLDQPILLLVVLAVGAAIGIAVEKLFAAQDRALKRAYWQRRFANKRRGGGPVPVGSSGLSKEDIAADQLKLVMKADFRDRPLLNKSEGNVFRVLDKIVIARNPQWQVMAQVSVGEFIACDDTDAYRCINSKRVDFVLMDEHCRARHALEYQGNGHHQGSAAARDAVKKEALRKAGIGYHEVVAGHTTPAELKRLVEKLVPAGVGAEA